jgi:hypothetical protein
MRALRLSATRPQDGYYGCGATRNSRSHFQPCDSGSHRYCRPTPLDGPVGGPAVQKPPGSPGAPVRQFPVLDAGAGEYTPDRGQAFWRCPVNSFHICCSGPSQKKGFQVSGVSVQRTENRRQIIKKLACSASVFCHLSCVC